MNSKDTHTLTLAFTESESTTEIQPHTVLNDIIRGTEHPSVNGQLTAQIANHCQENIACYSFAI
jgi:hypothetical protein